ncbi:MAG TPA: hypothetical protein VGD08_16280 [Stellaceae bacterium]|jgi:hypothetical protein
MASDTSKSADQIINDERIAALEAALRQCAELARRGIREGSHPLFHSIDEIATAVLMNQG